MRHKLQPLSALNKFKGKDAPKLRCKECPKESKNKSAGLYCVCCSTRDALYPICNPFSSVENQCWFDHLHKMEQAEGI